MGSDGVINMPWDLESFRGVKGFYCRASAKRGFGLWTASTELSCIWRKGGEERGQGGIFGPWSRGTSHVFLQTFFAPGHLGTAMLIQSKKSGTATLVKSQLVWICSVNSWFKPCGKAFPASPCEFPVLVLTGMQLIFCTAAAVVPDFGLVTGTILQLLLKIVYTASRYDIFWIPSKKGKNEVVFLLVFLNKCLSSQLCSCCYSWTFTIELYNSFFHRGNGNLWSC